MRILSKLLFVFVVLSAILSTSQAKIPTLAKNHLSMEPQIPQNALGDRKLIIDGAYAYVQQAKYHGANGILIYDINDPLAPILLGNIPHPDFDWVSGYGFDVSGNYLYAVSGGLYIFDISDPEQSTLVGENTEYDSRRFVYVDGHYVHMSKWEDFDVIVMDVSDPVHPTYVTNYAYGYEITKMRIMGNYAYLITGSDGVLIYDIENRTQPIEIGKFGWWQEPGFFYETIISLTLVGDYVYLTTYGVDARLRIIDVHDPTDPVDVAEYLLPWDMAGSAGLIAGDDQLYFDWFNWGSAPYELKAGVGIFDIADPEQIELINTYGDRGKFIQGYDLAGACLFYTMNDDIVGENRENLTTLCSETIPIPIEAITPTPTVTPTMTATPVQEERYYLPHYLRDS